MLVTQRYERTYGDSPENWAPRVPPFTVIQGHRIYHGSIWYLWLPITISDP